MRLFDTHLHLDDEQFDEIRDDVLARAREAGLIGMVAVGTDLASSRRAVGLAEQHEIVYAAVGIQPNSTHEAAAADWPQIEQLAQHPRVVAIGETGLDHYWEMAPLALQHDYFARHIALAADCGKPLVIHMREPRLEAAPIAEISCAQDIFGTLVEREDAAAIMHSYTGDIEMAARFVARGLHISFAGMVTYKKSEALRAVAQTIPADRLLIETDAPYLSPHPRRGQRPNEPALVRHTAECLAEVRGVSADELAKQTTDNALRLFNLQRHRT